MPVAILALVVLVALAALVYWSPRRVTVFEFERGLRYRRGRFVGTLPAGTHWVASRMGSITKVDIRPFVVTIPGQELLSSDGIGVKLSLVANVEVVDPAAAVNKVQNYTVALYTIIQVALRQIVSGRTLEDLIAGRADVGPKVLEASAEPALAFGLKIASVDVRDLMLPGDLKRIFAQEVAARKKAWPRWRRRGARPQRCATSPMPRAWSRTTPPFCNFGFCSSWVPRAGIPSCSAPTPSFRWPSARDAPPRTKKPGATPGPRPRQSECGGEVGI